MLLKYSITIMQVFVVIFLTINFVLAPSSGDEIEGDEIEENLIEGNIQWNYHDDLKHTICIGKIPKDKSEEEIRELLRPYGELKSFRLLRSPIRESKGYAFCELKDVSMTDQAVDELNGTLFGDKTLFLHKANSDRTVFIGDLALTLTEEWLRELLTSFGDLISFDFINDDADGTSYNFAFGEFSDRRTADIAAGALNAVKFHGKQLIAIKASSTPRI